MKNIQFLNFFPVQKLIFGHFWNCKKWILVKKFFREIDLFYFTSFFGLDFYVARIPIIVFNVLKKFSINTWEFYQITKQARNNLQAFCLIINSFFLSTKILKFWSSRSSLLLPRCFDTCLFRLLTQKRMSKL